MYMCTTRDVQEFCLQHQCKSQRNLGLRDSGVWSLELFVLKLVGLTVVVDFTGKERRFLFWLSCDGGGRCFGVLCERTFAWADLVAAMQWHLLVGMLLSSVESTERDVVDTSDCWSYLRKVCPCCCFWTRCFWTCMIIDGVGEVHTLPFMLFPLHVRGALLGGGCKDILSTQLSGDWLLKVSSSSLVKKPFWSSMRFSQGRAAIHRSSQLQPQWGALSDSISRQTPEFCPVSDLHCILPANQVRLLNTSIYAKKDHKEILPQQKQNVP